MLSFVSHKSHEENLSTVHELHSSSEKPAVCISQNPVVTACVKKKKLHVLKHVAVTSSLLTAACNLLGRSYVVCRCFQNDAMTILVEKVK